MSIETSCAFTGHRPTHFRFGFDETHPDCIRIKSALNVEIAHMIDAGVTNFYAGAALGVDQWAMEAVLEHRRTNPAVRLTAAVPCPEQAKRWTYEQQKRYRRLLEQCDKVEIVSDHHWQGCMAVRNQWMVNRAAHLIAVYDGSQTGGTAQTINYARRLERNVIVIPVPADIRPDSAR
ncbi:MAG: DUF1273 family protein [Clostridia bacterium]|nr:DUF1273 family protein [Clostridia bacterium]